MKPSKEGTQVEAEGDELGMRDYWDAKARENAMYFIHSTLDYTDTDEAEFWASGPDTLDKTLEPFGRTLLPTDQVVEIGCGIGRLTRALAQRAGRVVGIDVSKEMIERARGALADLTNVDLLVGSGSDLAGVADASMDVAYSFIVFQHIPDPAVTCHYIEEIGRVLRPGGWTVFQISELHEIHRRETWKSDESLKSWMRRMRGRKPRGCLEPQWLGSALTPDELLGALDRAGLVLDETIGAGTQYCGVNAHRPLS